MASSTHHPTLLSQEQVPPLQEELYMLSKRDSKEKDRLDQQSNLIRIIRDGCVLDPSIPKENVRRIADIATGTGIWLREVTAELASYAGHNGSPPYETVGFDIASDQFPAAPEPQSKFVVWDATTKFPAKYHEYFDVVHVRLITVAVTVEQIKLMTRNLVELLKPGGYLQWTDWTYTNGWESIYPSGPDGLSLEVEGKAMYEFHGEQGFSYDTTGVVTKTLEILPGLEKVQVTDHTGAARRKPEIREMVVEWHARVIPLFMEMMAVRQGQSKEQARITAHEYRKKAIEMGKRGTVFEVPLNTLVVKKSA